LSNDKDKRPRFDPELKVDGFKAFTTLEETKGEKFEQVQFADRESAVETIKNFSANISLRSKSLSKTLADMKFGTVPTD